MDLASEADRDIVRNLEGIFTGMLDDEEVISLERCIADHFAYRSYEGPAAMLGLSKVRLT